MKILLMGDASHYHRTLGRALAAAGHDVTVASSGSGWMQTSRDIDLSRRRGKLGGAFLQMRLSTTLAPKLRGYDIVQLCDTSFIELRPHRQLELAQRLRRHNGRLFLCALGNDPFYVSNLSGDNPALRYSEWQTPWGRSVESHYDRWTSPEMLDYNRRLVETVDGVTTALFEYQRVWESFQLPIPVSYVGIPIDTDNVDIAKAENGNTIDSNTLDGSTLGSNVESDGKLKVMFCSHKGRESEKGSDILLPMLRRLAADRPERVELLTPENVPYADFLRLLDRADIVSDQLYSYTPATTALLAMSRGAIAITGGEEEYYRFIGEPLDTPKPIFNPNPLDLEGTYRRLIDLIDNPGQIAAMRRAALPFVIRHNNSAEVASRALHAWLL